MKKTIMMIMMVLIAVSMINIANAEGVNPSGLDKTTSSYGYALNKVMVVPYGNRVDAHVVLRNTGQKEQTVNSRVYLVNMNGETVEKAVESSTKLGMRQVQRSMVSLNKPSKGNYILVVETDNGKMNGHSKRAVSVVVR